MAGRLRPDTVLSSGHSSLRQPAVEPPVSRKNYPLAPRPGGLLFRVLGPAPPSTRVTIPKADAERAGEIAAEFYPAKDTQPPELAELMVGPSDEDEQYARLCELARKLGYNEAKVRMKLGQWARNLAGLERELLNELDTLPEQPRTGLR